MTKTKDEGAEVLDRSRLPNPTFTEDQDDVSLPGANDVVEQMKGIQRRLDEMDKRWQSDKDRRIPQIEQRLDNFQSVLADYNKLVEGGVDANVAQWLIERLDTRVGEAEKEAAQPVRPSNQGTEATTDATSEAIGKLEKYGLSVNEPRFIELLRGRHRNNEAFQLAVNEYILERVVPGNTAVSGVAASQGAANEETAVEAENPIQDIEDSKMLYEMAYKDILKQRPRKAQ